MLPYNSLQEAETAIGRSLTASEALWFTYTSNMSDFIIYCHYIILFLLVSTLVPLVYLLIELIFPDHVASYKIQPKVKYSLYDNFKCYMNVTKTMFFVVIPLLLGSYRSTKMIGIRTSLPLPSLMEMVSQLIVYFVVEDYTHYWMHRFFHTKFVYENVHKVHHEYTAPFGYATQHVHWIEVVIFGIPSFLGPIIVPGHMITFVLWLIVRQIESIDTHSGYDFPFTKYIPFYVGADHHDYHHFVGGQSQSNFASIFTYCDYIYGTDKGYSYHKRLRQQKLKDGSKGVGKENGGSYASGPDMKSE